MRRKGMLRNYRLWGLMLALLMTPARAWAWGEDGHKIVAGVAESYLKKYAPATLERAKGLLGGKSLMDVATFADAVRNDRPYTKNWHFVDIPLDSDFYDPRRDCQSTPNGDCIIQAYYRFKDVLANPKENDCARAEALKYLVHFVGDLHQPLHAVDDGDQGGNTKLVRFYKFTGYEGKTPNLHAVWDTGILVQSGKSYTDYIALLSPTDAAGGTDMRVTIWAKESHALAQEAYLRLPQPNAQNIYVLDADNAYYDWALVQVKNRLALAGLRLGKLLQQTLG